MFVDNNIFVISDLHLFHKRIIDLERPQFSSVEEMNNTIISNWNNVVGDDDIVYVGGDYAVGGSTAQIEESIKQLNGHKILILGNHDYSRTKSRWKRMGFEEVLESKNIDNFILIVHAPVVNREKIRTGSIIVHGHVHSRKIEHPNYALVNMSAEVINFTPIRLNQLISEYFNFER